MAQQHAVESREIERRELVGALAAQETGDVAAQKLAPLLDRVGACAVELAHVDIVCEHVGEHRGAHATVCREIRCPDRRSDSSIGLAGCLWERAVSLNLLAFGVLAKIYPAVPDPARILLDWDRCRHG